MRPSAGGRFEVILDGELIFSKVSLKRHAEPGEVARLVEAKLGPPIPRD
jgi:selenoprotein W-related protein